MQQLSFENHFDYPQDAKEAKDKNPIIELDSLINHIDLEQLALQADADSELALVRPSDGLSTHDLFPIPLRPYQIDGSRFLRESRRAFCTYEPGLGKTETAIAACLDIDHPTSITTHTNVLCDDDGDYVAIETTNAHWRPTTDNGQPAKVVIFCPSYLTDEWFERIVQYIPDAKIVMCSGTRKQREKVLSLDADWYILNYEMLHKRQRNLTAKQQARMKHVPRDPYTIPEADYYIFDESQNLKNHNGKQAQAAAELVHPSSDPTLPIPHVYLLSGTPIKREPDDLYMQLHIMYPHGLTNSIYSDMYFRSYNDFVRQYCIYLPSPRGNVVVGAKGQSLVKLGQNTPIQRLMDKVAHYISYEDADIYRPDVQPIVKHMSLDEEFQKAYDDIASMYAYKDLRMFSSIEVLHALRATTACPAKLESAANLAEQFAPKLSSTSHTGHDSGCMFFTYYVGSAKLLARHLSKKLGIEVPWIAGQPHTSHEERTRILNSKPPFLVGTLKSLSTGINSLNYMKAVVFFEEDWTPDVLEQATDRVRRFGNDATKVFVYYLLAKNTIDDQIHAVVGRRGITAEAIVRRTLAKFKKDHKNHTGAIE